MKPIIVGSTQTATATSTAAIRSFRALILRHGQTDANADDVIQGSANFSRLTSLGKEQARAALAALSPTATDKNNKNSAYKVDTIYCSPLTRARETLQELRASQKSLGMTSNGWTIPMESEIILPNLREIDFYDWEGKSKEELEVSFPVEWQAWSNGDPHNLIVMETQKQDSGDKVIIPHYPLLELWQRAETVWGEIWNHQIAETSTGLVGGESNCFDSTVLIVAHGSLGHALLSTAIGSGPEKFRRYEFPNCGMVEIEWNHVPIEWNSSNNSPVQKHRPLATSWRWIWPTNTLSWRKWNSVLK